MRKQVPITDNQIVESAERCYGFFCSIYRFEPNDQDDIKQEIAIRLWRSRRNYVVDGNWKSFCLAVSKRAIQSYFREAPRVGVWWNKQANQSVPLEELLYEPAEEESYEALEIKDTLARLDRREKTVMLLAIAGYSQKEIADLMHTSENVIRQIVARLRLANSPSSSSLGTD
jgi:RNA polymerase sigma factor (sigma-70 family)